MMSTSYFEHFEEIISELTELYSLTRDMIEKIIIETISKEYNSDFPVIIEESGIHAIYKQNKELKFVKIIYSNKKIKNIIKNIKENAIKQFLKDKKKEMVKFLLEKKSYLHVIYSYSDEDKDYYGVYYDKNFNHKVNNIQAVFRNQKNKKRIYPDLIHFQYEKNTVLIKEYKRYRNIKNVREFTKDIAREIYEKIERKIWIEAKGINLNKKEVYIHIPYKTTNEVIEYISFKYKEIFALKMVLITKKSA